MYENLTVGRTTTHLSLEKKQFVDIIPFKVIDENVQHYYGQKNVQSLAEIVLDVFTYNFKRRNDINKLFFSNGR